MTANINPLNNIAYGIISMHSIHSDVQHELLYTHGKDLSYGSALKEHLDLKRQEHEEANENLVIKRAETGEDRENDPNLGEDDPEFDEDFETEEFSESYQCDEPVTAGEYQGVHYQTTWLGGALMMYMFKSPVLTKCRPCSPCVPNAGDLDSVGDYLAYGVPVDWLDGGFIERQISAAGCCVVPEKDHFVFLSSYGQNISKATWATYDEAAEACYKRELQITLQQHLIDKERKSEKNANFGAKYGIDPGLVDTEGTCEFGIADPKVPK